MADAGDLKSLALDGRAGSSPALAIFIEAPSVFRSGLFLSPFRRFLPLYRFFDVFPLVGAETEASASLKVLPTCPFPLVSRFGTPRNR